jgi:KEOPS complex subunit Pcc1
MNFDFKAEFEFDFEDESIAKTVYESVKRELEDDQRYFVDIILKGDKLNICINANDVVGLRAATNTWLRLIKIAEEMVHVIREHKHGNRV